ncbi:MAG: exopolysaccharide biosynthesis polyprenyl glycosylphosphotransferase [Prevotella sp.]|nr:exopolysaccharide biosynthesis polyprenyl glycosylphosphotransferase [Prevotella sp.]
MVSVIDWLTFNVVFFVGSYIFDFPYLNVGDNGIYNAIMANISYIIALQFVTISLHHRHLQPAKVLSNTSRTSAIFIVLYAAFLGMSHVAVPGFYSSIIIFLIVFITTSIERLIFRSYLLNKKTSKSNNVKTIILGSGQMAQRAVDFMTNVWNGYNLIGYFHESDKNRLTNMITGEEIPYLGSKNMLIRYLEENQVDELYVDSAYGDIEEEKSLFRLCEAKMIRIYYLPTINNIRKAQIKEFGAIYVMARYNEPLSDVRNRIVKRIFDFVVSLVFTCTIFPIVLIIVTIITKITMPGPIFFKQKRTGYDGKEFYCYKFRSMKVNKECDELQAVKNDPRITKWGSFMRHTNIDEFPQFINVLKGDMSIVGPRPHMLAHTDYYSKFIADYMIRHFVKPGITGWAQTHGERGETQTIDDMKRRVEKDIWYIEHWNFWLDIQIIMKTVADMIRGDKKAY